MCVFVYIYIWVFFVCLNRVHIVYWRDIRHLSKVFGMWFCFPQPPLYKYVKGFVNSTAGDGYVDGAGAGAFPWAQGSLGFLIGAPGGVPPGVLW